MMGYYFTHNYPKMGSFYVSNPSVERVGRYKIRVTNSFLYSSFFNFRPVASPLPNTNSDMISQMNNEREDEINNRQSPSDFSIDHILNRAGNNVTCSGVNFDSFSESSSRSYSLGPFPWLRCSRYFPPKVPRTQKREGPQKRQLGRHPRIPFSSHQLSVLEDKFRQSPYLSSEEVSVLSRKLDLADIRVKIWFQNRRARERRERPSTASNSTESTSNPHGDNVGNPRLSPHLSSDESATTPLVTDRNPVLYTHMLQPNLIIQDGIRQYFHHISNLMPPESHIPKEDTC